MRALPLVTALQQENSKYGSLCLQERKVFLPRIVHVQYDFDRIYMKKSCCTSSSKKLNFNDIKTLLR